MYEQCVHTLVLLYILYLPCVAVPYWCFDVIIGFVCACPVVLTSDLEGVKVVG